MDHLTSYLIDQGQEFYQPNHMVLSLSSFRSKPWLRPFLFLLTLFLLLTVTFIIHYNSVETTTKTDDGDEKRSDNVKLKNQDSSKTTKFYVQSTKSTQLKDDDSVEDEDITDSIAVIEKLALALLESEEEISILMHVPGMCTELENWLKTGLKNYKPETKELVSKNLVEKCQKLDKQRKAKKSHGRKAYEARKKKLIENFKVSTASVKKENNMKTLKSTKNKVNKINKVKFDESKNKTKIYECESE